MQVERNHYFSNYDDAQRYASYWHQIDETSSLGGRILEVGVGNGTVSTILRARGFDVTTVDLDPALAPDVMGDVRNLPLPNNSFDTVLAAEVLEHLPWEDVRLAVAEIARVARRGVVLSVPDANVAFDLTASIPNVFHLARMLARRRLPLRHALWALSVRAAWRRSGGLVRWAASVPPIHTDWPPRSDQHYWELGLGAVDQAALTEVFSNAELRVVREFRVSNNPYHHFFVLGTSRPTTGHEPGN
jgi:SAM-dependent methyltransferase